VSSGVALLITFAAGLLAGALWRSNWIARLLAERGRLRMRCGLPRHVEPVPPSANAG